MAIGTTIQQWRKKRGLSAEDVERLAVISSSILERVEAGDLDPSASMVSALADAFGIPIPWLYTDPKQLDSLLEEGTLAEDDLRGSADPVTDRILRARRNHQDLFLLLVSLIEHGDPKLLNATEINLKSLVKETRKAPIPWANRQPGNFSPPDD